MKGSSRVMEKSDFALHLEASLLVREVWKDSFLFCWERINDKVIELCMKSELERSEDEGGTLSALIFNIVLPCISSGQTLPRTSYVANKPLSMETI